MSYLRQTLNRQREQKAPYDAFRVKVWLGVYASCIAAACFWVWVICKVIG